MTAIDAKHFYNEVMPEKQGADYEYARWHKNAIASVGYEQTKASIQKNLPSLQSGANILEVGPGAGTWTKVLIKKYPDAQLTLLDISKEMLERSRAALGDVPITYVESAFGDYESDTQYDFFFSSRMLEYTEDKAEFVKKIKSLVRPGGEVVVTTKFPHYTRQKLQGKKISGFHTGQISPAALAKLFRDQGFVVTAIKPITISIPVFKSAWLNKTLGGIIRLVPLNPLTNTCVESYLIRATRT